jgi:hypothetical protein
VCDQIPAVQILANALPGFRDLRGPLIAGYMWLIFAWLIVQPNPNHRPSDSFGAALHDLGHDIGRVLVLIAISVAAYLIGAVSQYLSEPLRRSGSLFAVLYGGFDINAEARLRPLELRAEAEIDTALEEERIRSIDAERFIEMFQNRARAAAYEAERELELPAILLVGDQSELFAEVDRLRAEGELRLAVVPPLVALTGLLAVEVSWWWLTALLAAVVLIFQGLERDLDAKKSIADAIRIGRVPSSSSANLEAWIRDDLSAEIKDAEQRNPKRPSR